MKYLDLLSTIGDIIFAVDSIIIESKTITDAPTYAPSILSPCAGCQLDDDNDSVFILIVLLIIAVLLLTGVCLWASTYRPCSDHPREVDREEHTVSAVSNVSTTNDMELSISHNYDPIAI